MSARENIEYFVKYFGRMEPAAPGADTKQLRTRFDIGNKGKIILSLRLSRPVYRIGDEVLVFLDLSKAPMTCYHVTATLECTELILAAVMRVVDGPSDETHPPTEKVVNRVYSQISKSLFTTDKVHLGFAIPFTGTPQFATTAVTVSWSIRFDFTTAPLDSSHQAGSSSHDFLISGSGADERGQTFVAKDKLVTESFACRIPLQVYPTNQDIGALLDHYASYVTRNFYI
jgi:hypothetical protein